MARNLKPKLYVPVLFLLLSILLFGISKAEVEHEVSQKLRAAPHKNVVTKVIDGTGVENSFSFEDTNSLLGDKKGGISKVSVSTVALFTLAMAAATGLGAVPFFFVELDPQWAGLCNGMAAGVMLAASFDLIREGQDHDAGNWVVTGILAGGIFIWLCKKVMMFLPVFYTSIILCLILEKVVDLSCFFFFSSFLETVVLCRYMNFFFSVVMILSTFLNASQAGFHNLYMIIPLGHKDDFGCNYITLKKPK